MPAVLFDTLKMVETLEAGGFTGQQARAMTTALGDAATVADVATRGDLIDLGVGLRHDIDALRTDVKNDIDALRTEVKRDIDALRTEVKHDIDALRTEVKHDIDALRTNVKHDIDALRIEFKHDLASLEQRMTIRMGSMMVVLAGVLSAVFHYLR